MSEKSTLSKNLIKARKLRRWSQRGAAQAIKEAGAEWFNRPVLGSYEEDRAQPSNATLIVMCKVYQVEDIKAFVTDPEFFENKNTPEEIHRRYLSLSGSAKKAVDALLGFVC